MARYDDLDPATRKAVDAAIGRRSSSKTKERQRPRLSRAMPPDDGTGLYRCTCGATFTVWRDADKHPAGPGHGRMEAVLNRPVTPTP